MSVSNSLRDLRRIDWMKFGRITINKFTVAQISSIGMIYELESKVRALEKTFETTFKILRYSKNTLPP